MMSSSRPTPAAHNVDVSDVLRFLRVERIRYLDMVDMLYLQELAPSAREFCAVVLWLFVGGTWVVVHCSLLSP